MGAIIRDDEFIAPRGSTIIEPGDMVILFASREAIGEVEKLLSVRPDFF